MSNSIILAMSILFRIENHWNHSTISGFFEVKCVFLILDKNNFISFHQFSASKTNKGKISACPQRFDPFFAVFRVGNSSTLLANKKAEPSSNQKKFNVEIFWCNGIHILNTMTYIHTCSKPKQRRKTSCQLFVEPLCIQHVSF